MRRENLILKSIYEERTEKMRSSRGKAPLRMTAFLIISVFSG
jgi:hypothetical protein